MATVSDDPLDKKVEMTNWEKVRYDHLPTQACTKRRTVWLGVDIFDRVITSITSE